MKLFWCTTAGQQGCRTTTHLMKTLKGSNQTLAGSAWSYVRPALLLLLSSTMIIILTSQVSGPAHVYGPYFGQQPPGKTPTAFGQGIIPDDLHSVPVFTADARKVFYKPLDGNSIMVMRDDGKG